MDSVEKYLAEVLAAIRPLPSREIALADVLGAVLDGDVTAQWPLPSFDNSAMDGYAVRAADIASASAEHPVSLPVTGEIPAGSTARNSVDPGTSMQIMTGAPMPSGADTVVPVEATDGGTATVAIREALSAGSSVRFASVVFCSRLDRHTPSISRIARRTRLQLLFQLKQQCLDGANGRM